MKWKVRVFEVKETPDMNTPLRKVGAKMVPQDAIPKESKDQDFFVRANNADAAKRAVLDSFKKRGVRVRAVSFSSENSDEMIAYVFKRS
jgi:hypothetical protein